MEHDAYDPVDDLWFVPSFVTESTLHTRQRMVYTIDGSRFRALEEFFNEVSAVVVPGSELGRNLDAFNDILQGGSGHTRGWNHNPLAESCGIDAGDRRVRAAFEASSQDQRTAPVYPARFAIPAPYQPHPLPRRPPPGRVPHPPRHPPRFNLHSTASEQRFRPNGILVQRRGVAVSLIPTPSRAGHPKTLCAIGPAARPLPPATACATGSALRATGVQ